MYFHNSRDVLIYFAVKYDGNPIKILTAMELHEHEKVPPEEMKRVCDSLKCKAVTFVDYDYPKKLKEIFHPPLVLFYYGDITLISDDQRKYGVVGARDYTEHGEFVTNKIVSEMAKGTVLVSGMARGIDTIAHTAQIRNGGRTIAVLGSGVDVCYPPENLELYNYLKKKHLVISEYPCGSEPLGAHFPLRNRIIAALSDTLIVPQVRSLQSGTMITVDHMVYLGRPMYFAPNPFNEDSVNNKILIEGADMVESGQQILEDMHWDK